MTLTGYLIIFLILIIMVLAFLWWNEKRKRTKNAVEQLNKSFIELISEMKHQTIELLTFVRNDVNRLDNHFNSVTKAITKVFENGTAKMKKAAGDLGFDKDTI